MNLLFLCKLHEVYIVDDQVFYCSRVRCDGDGWVIQVNDEVQYPHFYHKVPLENITHVDFTGDVEFNYVGFGGPDQQPAPPVGFNLTFFCPEGMVFNHDWFATPFVMMTCQVRSY